MNKVEIEQIWNEQRELDKERNWFSMEELRAIRNKYSSNITLSKHRLLLFDSIYKAIVILGYALLLFIGEITLLKAGLTLLISGGLLLLIFKNGQLKKAIHKLDTSKDLISVLKEQYRFLNQFYREFLLIGSITHPFFVLAGFQFYHFFKYQADGLVSLIGDPVTYVFLFLAFIVPFVIQKFIYAKELKELEQILDIELDEVSSEINLIRHYEIKRVRLIVFGLLILIGTLVLFIVLNVVL